MIKDRSLLVLIVLIAIAVRVLILWIGRPEFVGWFNHTYYYYVEVKGILADGILPFPDMPLLFYIYALTAKLLIWIGVDFHPAIVASTRFWMSIIPSLMPIPVYFILRSIVNQPKITKRYWMVVLASAFLPLTLLHIPEFLQKNTLGMLLLATFMLLAKKTPSSYKTKDVITLIIVFISIALTHYGSTGVAILYTLAIFLAYLIIGEKSNSTKAYLGIIGVTSMVVFGTIYLFDSERFFRIFFYMSHSLGTSLLGALFSMKGNFNQQLAAAFGVIVPFLIALFFYRLYRKNSKSLTDENRLFWLSNIFFGYLLIFPAYDQLLLGRLVIFLSLPLLFILIFVLHYVVNKAIIRNTIIILIVLGAFSMAFGEIMSLKFHNRDKEDIYTDLMRIKEKPSFQTDDLIITKNGAEHICNWFLNTKSSLITSLNVRDFKKYNNIFILNPIEGELNFQGIEDKDVRNKADEYIFMLRNIPKPKSAKVIFESEHLELLLLPTVPEEWQFDERGNWIGYEKFYDDL